METIIPELRESQRRWHERRRSDMELLIGRQIRETQEAIAQIEQARRERLNPNTTRDPELVYRSTAAQIIDFARDAGVELSANEVDELVAARMKGRNFTKEEIAVALDESPAARSKLSDKDRDEYKSEIQKRLAGDPVELTKDRRREDVEALNALMSGNAKQASQSSNPKIKAAAKELQEQQELQSKGGPAPAPRMPTIG